MKKKKYIIGLSLGVVLLLALIAVVIAVLLNRKDDKTADMNAYERSLIGKWAYLHDLDTKAAVFEKDGSAKFEGKKYSFSCDGDYIHLTDDEGNTKKLRYKKSSDSEMNVYIQSRYVLENGEIPSSIEGVWVCRDTNWTFEFTSKGTFLEDGAFTGHYFVDEEPGTIKLVYEMYLEDAVMYYDLSEDGLFIEDPWPMKKVK